MTIKEALAEGYKLCGYSGEEYQDLMKIDEVDSHSMRSDLVLAEKEGFSPTIPGEIIAGLIADYMETNWGEDTGDDTEFVYKTVGQMDFSKTAEEINSALKGKVLYNLTNIKLTLE